MANHSYMRQIGTLVSKGQASLGPVPTLVGEVGIPYDVNESLQKAPGNYRCQTILMDALISGLERNWVSFTLWNYNPSNTVARGDMWNMEDFSIINQEAHAHDLANWYGNEPMYSGGRGLPAIIRPYASKVAGIPKSSSWNRHCRRFYFTWVSNSRPVERDATESSLSCVTEIFVPDYYFRGITPEILVSDGKAIYEPEKQTVYIVTDKNEPGVVHSVQIRVPSTKTLKLWQFILALLILAAGIWIAYTA